MPPSKISLALMDRLVDISISLFKFQPTLGMQQLLMIAMTLPSIINPARKLSIQTYSLKGGEYYVLQKKKTCIKI
jgi:hypothetical protein